MEKLKKIAKNENTYKILFIILMFFICFITSISVKYGNAPDEQMKELVCKYIYQNNALPKGDDSAVLNTLWGTSYAFTPMLSYMVSAFFMKIVALFSNDYTNIFLSARFASVLFYTGTVIFVIKIGDMLFKKDKIYKWLFIVLTTCLPQLIFLGSYINSDSLAIFSISIIIYSWILGIYTKWKWKSVIILGIGIGICALSYYNSYGYILTSIPIFIISFFITKSNKYKLLTEKVYEKENNTDKNYKKEKIIELVKKGISITLISFAIAGWWFIRSYIIYDGDFLGLKASDKCAELNAVSEYKPSVHKTPQNSNQSVFDMIFAGGWLKETMKSFIGIFGHATITMPTLIYLFFVIIYIISFIGIIIYFINSIKNKYYKKEKNKLLLEIIFIINIIITFYLSIYYSYSSDFQPQGRYIMPIVIPYMYFVTIGLKQIIEKILNIKFIKAKVEQKVKVEKLENVIISIIILIAILVVWVFYKKAIM